eukprot:11759391-Prorocentrum_lima.AAC.1
MRFLPRRRPPVIFHGGRELVLIVAVPSLFQLHCIFRLPPVRKLWARSCKFLSRGRGEGPFQAVEPPQ